MFTGGGWTGGDPTGNPERAAPFNGNLKMHVEVALPLPINQTFTYRMEGTLPSPGTACSSHSSEASRSGGYSRRVILPV